MWIDSHCHLNDERFANDYDAVIKRAIEAEIGGMIVVGYDVPSSRRALELAKTYPVIWAAVGLHPHDAKLWDPLVRKELESLLLAPEVVAVGEIGLDFHYNYSSRDEQIRAFKEQIQLAREYDKPVIIHNREAHQDTLKVLDEVKLGKAGGVMHCFAGSKEMALACLKNNLYISFAGTLTFHNARRLAELALELPLDKVLVETDSPYLTPEPFRGRRNEPSFVKWVGQKLAEIKNISVETVMQITTENCQALFKLNQNGDLMKDDSGKG